MKKLTLIGGAPLSGKTTLSKEIAREHGAVEISTDSIRSWMKSLLKESDYPDLFYSANLTAAEFYKKYTSPERVVSGEIAQGEEVIKGIIALLETEVSWDHLVIEGIALAPKAMRELEARFGKDRGVELIILADLVDERILRRIGSRGLWGPKGTYPENLIPKEAEWVVMYNRWFVEQADKYDISVRYI